MSSECYVNNSVTILQFVLKLSFHGHTEAAKLRKFVHGVDFTWDPRGGAYRLNTSLDSIVHLWEQVSAYVLDVAMLISYLNAIITREIKIISAFVNICLK